MAPAKPIDQPPATKTSLYGEGFPIIFLSQVFFVLGNSLMTHFARWLEFLGGDVRTVGNVNGLAPMLSLALRPWVGPWIDRLGMRRTWVLGQLLVLIVVPANLLADAIGPLTYVLRTLLTLGTAIVFASSLTYVSTTTPIERRTEAIGLFGTAGFLGMLFGPAAGDWLLNHDPRHWGHFASYFCLATAGFGASLALLMLLPAPPRTVHAAPIRLPFFLTIVRRHWPGIVMIVNLVFGMCMLLPFAFLSKFIDDRKLMSVGVWQFFLVYAGWGLTLRVLTRELSNDDRSRSMLATGMAAYGIGAACFCIVGPQHEWLLLAAAWFCGTGHALMFHTMVAQSIATFPPEHRGIGSTLALMMCDIGTVVGGPILGQIAAWGGYSIMYLTVSSLCLGTTAVYWWWTSRRWPRRTGAAE